MKHSSAGHRGTTVRRVSYFKRSLADILDFLLLLALNIGLWWVTIATQQLQYTPVNLLLMICLSALVCWLYCAGFESSRIMATPGKFIFNMQVTDLKGRQISFTTASLRFILKVLVRPRYIYGFNSILFDWSGKRYQGDEPYHDRVAKTMVKYRLAEEER